MTSILRFRRDIRLLNLQISSLATCKTHKIHNISYFSLLARLVSFAIIFSREASLIFHENSREKNCETRLAVNSNSDHLVLSYSPRCLSRLIWARILKHSMEAEKSAFQGELSLQRSGCTAGLTVATTFLLLLRTILCIQLSKTLK